MEKMLTAIEVAALLHVHVNTVRRWNNQGIIKAYRIGPRGVRRFRQQDISAFLTQCQNNPDPK
jgi:excisionase family DNA binding protein